MALEFILKLQDLMTPKLGASVQKADAQLQRMQNNATKGNRAMGASFEDVRKRVEQLRTTASKATDWKLFKDATRQANDLEKQMDNLERKASGKGSGGFLKGMIGGAVAYGAISIGKDALQAAAEREKQRVNFEVMTGSKQTGNDLLGKIVRMADVTPFESKDLIGNAKMLMQYGLGVEKVMPTLQKLGDISGADKEKMESLTMAFGKVISEGKLNGRALEEMIYAGYNPLNDIAKKTGISMAELRKQMEKGAISAKMVEQAFDSATGPGGRFYNLMEKQSQTLAGRYSTLMDNYHHKLTDIGEAMMPVASYLLDMTANGLTWLNISKSQSEKLIGEKLEMNELVRMISSYNEKTEERKVLVTQLENKYPELLKGLDREKFTNDQLAASLQKVNEQYNQRIQLANSVSLRDSNKKMYQDAQGEQIRMSAIASALKSGDITSAKSLMNPIERGAFAMGLDKDYFRREAIDNGVAAVDAKKRMQKYDNEASIGELFQRAKSLSDLANNKTDLSAKISDPKKRSSFMQLAKNISFAGNVAHFPGVGLLDKMDSLMNGSSAGGSGADGGLGDLKGASEKGMSGQKEVTINIQKLGIDKFELHSINVKEGVAELEKMMREMFLRIVYSANGMAVN